MKISEVITVLEEMMRECGDINVCVDYGDAGGSYNGQADAEIYEENGYVHFSHGDNISI